MDSTRTDSTGLTASDMIRKLLKPSGHESRPITQGGHAGSEVADTTKMIADILKLFPGAELVATERPLFCRDCDKALIADRERPYSAVSFGGILRQGSRFAVGSAQKQDRAKDVAGWPWRVDM